ncbi:M3 family metallopeptidase [Chitinimonas lacunae]|uniref:oligopeptidase A n=1 Tax=Chitinimonas lacunae TaxID=1963018 RepID=A0ABV8MVV1_9NEIS
MATPDNPLLDFSTLPRFDLIRPEHIGPAIDTLLDEARAAVARAETLTDPDWDSFVAPLDDATERLGRAWNQVNHLQAVVNTPALREAYNQNLPKLSQFSTEVGQNLALFAQYKKIAASPQYQDLSRAQKKIIENALRDFRLSGAELDEAGKRRFAAISEELASLSAKYEQNVLDATDAFVHYVEDEAELAGVPDDVKAACRAAAEAEGRSGFKLTLHMPCYLPLLQYGENRALRERLYHAYVTRASEFGPAERDNSSLIERILTLRTELAGLLGYPGYGDYSLATKMAESPAQVLEFLRDLGRRAKPFAARDRAELEAFAREQLGLHDLSSWDVPFVSEKLKEARYSFSEQEVKAHFTEPVVLAGLFGVIEKLFGVRAEADEAPLWHPDARFYRLTDREGRLVGQFYLDLYARPNKRGGAWMDDCRNRRRRGSGQQTPLVYLTCNFGRGSESRPATFSHDEVITLFHEFGHGLHQLLTEVDELGVAGINGVEWDAVELPSQFMENFCWEWEVVSGMSAHIDTGEPLPRELFDRMLAAKNFLSGMQTVRQLEFGLFDMELHSRFLPGRDRVLDLLQRVRDEVAVNRPPAYDRLPCAFTHIFSGGYAAGYFSYKWAEVLSADAYGAFEERGGIDSETGERFRREILAVGGSRPALESFRAFRGREPSLEALLRHNGMVAEPA